MLNAGANKSWRTVFDHWNRMTQQVGTPENMGLNEVIQTSRLGT